MRAEDPTTNPAARSPERPVATEPGRLRRAWGALGPTVWVGGALGVSVSELVLDAPVARSTAVLGGAAYALLLRVLVRAVPVAAWARPLVGLAIGAAPLALTVARTLPRDERLALGLAGALFGALIGALDAARRA